MHLFSLKRLIMTLKKLVLRMSLKLKETCFLQFGNIYQLKADVQHEIFNNLVKLKNIIEKGH